MGKAIDVIDQMILEYENQLQMLRYVWDNNDNKSLSNSHIVFQITATEGAIQSLKRLKEKLECP